MIFYGVRHSNKEVIEVFSFTVFVINIFRTVFEHIFYGNFLNPPSPRNPEPNIFLVSQCRMEPIISITVSIQKKQDNLGIVSIEWLL